MRSFARVFSPELCQRKAARDDTEMTVVEFYESENNVTGV